MHDDGYVTAYIASDDRDELPRAALAELRRIDEGHSAKASESCDSLAFPPPSRKGRFGGRTDIERVYTVTKELIIKHKLLVLKQFEEVDGVKRLTICNFWRLERHPDQTTKAFEFDFTSGKWVATTSFKEWPVIPIWPLAVTKRPSYWIEVIRTVIWKALGAAGFDELPQFLNPFPQRAWEKHFALQAKKGYAYDNENLLWYRIKDRHYLKPAEAKKLGIHAPKGYKPEMTPGMMAYSLLKAYTTPAKKKGKGWLRKESMEKGARALRAVIWSQILDREVVSAMLALDRLNLSFQSCLDWSVNRRHHLLRWANEQRNLLPILASIDYQHWSRDDLFSRKLWVRGSRKGTAVDRTGFSVNANAGFQGRRVRFRSFENKATWRWLSNASIVAVGRWVECGRDSALASNLASAASNVQKKIPVVALLRLIENSPDYRNARNSPRYGVSPVLQHLYRLYLMHAAQLWADAGHKAVAQWCGSRGSRRFGDVIDYLEAEGFERGIPDKNSTWASLERRSADWHRRTAIENMERQTGRANQTWEAALPEIEIDGIVCRPLLSSREMAVEGYSMGHCVGGYTSWCVDGRYRVYSLNEPDGTLSTLGLQITRTKVAIQQHRGKYNGPISPLAEAAGRELAKRYREALGTRKNRRSSQPTEPVTDNVERHEQ